jgi:hypothetical protein
MAPHAPGCFVQALLTLNFTAGACSTALPRASMPPEMQRRVFTTGGVAGADRAGFP